MQLLKRLGCLGTKQSFALFLCFFCQKEVIRTLGNGLKQESCECQPKNYKHGDCYTKLYKVWSNMLQRILNHNHISYKNYGGRGIKVCQAWQDDYITFFNWAINNGYKEGLQIDRINNNGNYDPLNCQWISNKENSHNKRSNKLTLSKVNEIRCLYNNENYKGRELADMYDVAISTIYSIINNKRWI